MRFLGLASLVLATVLGATNASAGFIPIDNFDGNVTGNVTGLVNVSAGSGTTNAGLNLNSEILFGTTNGIALEYGMTGFNFSSFVDTVRFTGVTSTSGLTNVVFTAEIYRGASLVDSATGGLMGSDVVFTFDAVDMSGITGMNFLFLRNNASGGAFDIQASSLQAVPEPTTLALIGLVGAGGGVAGWRRRRAAKA